MNILLHAYVDKNIGDDIFVYLICNRYKNVNFYIYTPNRLGDNCYKYPNITCIKYKEVPRIVAAFDRRVFKGKIKTWCKYKTLRRLDKVTAPRMDAQVWLGGSQFVETPNWKKILKYKKSQQSYNTPFFSISSTVGPIISSDYREAAISIMKGYTKICFRDKESYILSNKLSNSSYEPDMVFSIEDNHVEKNRCICISVIDIRRRFGEAIGSKYEKFIRKIIDFYSKRNYYIHLLSFCNVQGDSSYFETILGNALLEKNVEIISYDDNLQQIIRTIASSEIMIGTRYHSIVLGLRYGLKVLPIIYESKTENLLNDIGINGLELANIDSEVINNFEKYFVSLSDAQICTLRAAGERQFEAIDCFLKRRIL